MDDQAPIPPETDLPPPDLETPSDPATMPVQETPPDPETPADPETPPVPGQSPDPLIPPETPGGEGGGGGGDGGEGGAADSGGDGAGGQRTLVIAAVVVVAALFGLWFFMRGGGGSPGEGELPTAEATLVAEASAEPATAEPATGEAPEATLPPTGPAASATPLPGPPVAVIDAAAAATVGVPVSFSGARSAGGSPIRSHIWDFGDGSRAAGVEVSHSYDLAGRFQVILTVVDEAGRSSTARHIVEVQAATRVPPSARISGPTQARVGESLSFDGSASVAGDGSINAYTWRFGDGATASGRTVSHAYERAGTYYVVLEVADSNGLSDSATHEVVVSAPDPPRAVISGPTRTTVGTVVTFDGRGSSSGSPIQRFEWDFGDGGRSQASVTTWAYQAAGSFTVRLTVRDAAGRSDTASQSITVEARPQQPPTAALSGPSEATTGSAVSFSAEASRPGSNPIARYDWTVNGASLPGEGAGFTHTFSTPGVYTLAVLVTDSAGLSDTASMDVTVQADLDAVVWVLDGSAPPITMTASEGNASGSTGCNTFFVGFVATGDASAGQVAMGPISTSQAACAGPAGDQEQAFLAALEGVTSYAIADGRLTLDGSGGSLIFSAQAAAGLGPAMIP